MYKKVIKALQSISDLVIRENEPMNLHTTFKIGGPARFFLDAYSTDAAVNSLNILRGFDISPLVIGNGSNLLISDNGYDGFILKLSCNNVYVDGTSITAEAGALLSSVATAAQKNALTGLEFAHGIPGTVGGAVVMNAGAYGGEIKNVLVCSTCLSADGIKNVSNAEHNFGYRKSIYKLNPQLTVLSAKFELSYGSANDISGTMHELATCRRDKQPLEFPSAGSVFKRPEGHFAGALIEQSGLKGFAIGGAKVSEKHAGFIINYNNASAKDVKMLISHIQETVYKNTGISLECEICII